MPNGYNILLIENQWGSGGDTYFPEMLKHFEANQRPPCDEANTSNTIYKSTRGKLAWDRDYIDYILLFSLVQRCAEWIGCYKPRPTHYGMLTHLHGERERESEQSCTGTLVRLCPKNDFERPLAFSILTQRCIRSRQDTTKDD